MSRSGPPPLAALHRVLSDALAELERVGEFTAAAHLVAALDALECSSEARRDATADGAVTVLARRMRDSFGEGAEAVARRQLGAATGNSLTAWAAIVNELEG